MRADIFVDTSILVHAHDRQAGERHERARGLIDGLWERREVPGISVQVLQELHVNLVRKGVDVEESGVIVSRYFAWQVVDNSRALLREALRVQARRQLSFGNALILAAAQRVGVSVCWSEDFSEGRDYGGVRVVNPLRGHGDATGPL